MSSPLLSTYHLPMFCVCSTFVWMIANYDIRLGWVAMTWFAFVFLWNIFSTEKLNVARMSPNPSAMNEGKVWLTLRDSFLPNVPGIQKTSKYILKAVEVFISLSTLWNIPLSTIREIATLNLFWNSKRKNTRDSMVFYHECRQTLVSCQIR